MKMKMTMMTKLALAAIMLPAVAYAEKKPTVVLVHKQAQDDANWSAVAQGLASDGYTVISSAIPEGQTAAAQEQDLTRMLDGNDKMLLVGTEAGSGVIADFAAAQPAKVKGLVYLTGKLTPDVQTDAAVSALPHFVVRLANEKNIREQQEAGVTIYTVPAKGTPVMARTEALTDAIERAAKSKAAPAVAAVAQTSATQVATLR